MAVYFNSGFDTSSARSLLLLARDDIGFGLTMTLIFVIVAALSVPLLYVAGFYVYDFVTEQHTTSRAFMAALCSSVIASILVVFVEGITETRKAFMH